MLRLMVLSISVILTIGIMVRPLAGAILVNLSTISVVRWMSGDDHAGSLAGTFLARAQHWMQLPPRHADRVSRFQALAASPPLTFPLRPVELYERMQLARQHQDIEQAKAIEKQLVGLQPQYPLDEPTPVEAPAGWTLLGYDLARPMLGPRSTVAIVLYWQHDVLLARSPESTSIGDWDWVWTGRRAYQIGHVTNLAPNGGFERTLDLSEARPFGWPGQGPAYRANRVGDPSLILDKREELPTVVLYLDNSFRQTSAFLSESIEVRSDLVYLLTAWVRTELNGRFCMITGWNHPIQGLVKEYAACGGSSTWTHYAGLIQFPPDATQRQLWLVHGNLGGRAYFDDVLFFSLDLKALAQIPTS